MQSQTVCHSVDEWKHSGEGQESSVREEIVDELDEMWEKYGMKGWKKQVGGERMSVEQGRTRQYLYAPREPPKHKQT